jgi:APA family basic amino acid/polyamine antiporter
VKPENWSPFAPFGLTGISFFGKTLFGQTGPAGEPLGMLAGAAIVFFAYIGFDSVSTHAEEARNPSRDVPIGIIVSLVLCTVLYIAVAGVLTGMVKYSDLDIDAPVSDAFRRQDCRGRAAHRSARSRASRRCCLMLSQARIFLAMARDGVCVSFFSRAPRFRAP